MGTTDPELRSALLLLHFAKLDRALGSEVEDHLRVLYNTPLPESRVATIVDLFTEPRLLSAIREGLQTKAPKSMRDLGKTMAEVLTGEAKPWLPFVDPQASAKAAEATSPSEPSSSDAPRTQAKAPPPFDSETSLWQMGRADFGKVNIKISDVRVIALTGKLPSLRRDVENGSIFEGIAANLRQNDPEMGNIDAVKLKAQSEVTFVEHPRDEVLMNRLEYIIHNDERFKPLRYELNYARTLETNGSPSYKRHIDGLLLPMARRMPADGGMPSAEDVETIVGHARSARKLLGEVEGSPLKMELVKLILFDYTPGPLLLELLPEAKHFGSSLRVPVAREALKRLEESKPSFRTVREVDWAMMGTIVNYLQHTHPDQPGLDEARRMLQSKKFMSGKPTPKMKRFMGGVLRAGLGLSRRGYTLTFAEFVSGVKDPRRLTPDGWEAYTPIEKLHGIAPEFALVRKVSWEDMQERLSPISRSGSIRKLMEFGQRHAEFRQACMALVFTTNASVSESYKNRIDHLGERVGNPMTSDSARAEDFVKTITEPSFLAETRTAWQQKFQFRGKEMGVGTIAEFLTGAKEPWLPKIESTGGGKKSGSGTPSGAATPSPAAPAAPTTPAAPNFRAKRASAGAPIDRFLSAPAASPDLDAMRGADVMAAESGLFGSAELALSNSGFEMGISGAATPAATMSQLPLTTLQFVR